MADGGCDDILVPFNIVGAAKLERLRSPARAGRARRLRRRRGTPARARRSRAEAPRESWACSSTATRASAGRASRPPRQPWTSPAAVASHDGLRFDGFLTYPAPEGADGFLAAAVAGARKRGLDASGRLRGRDAVDVGERCVTPDGDRVSRGQLRLLRPHVDRGRRRLARRRRAHGARHRRQPPGTGPRSPRRRLEGADVGPRPRPRASASCSRRRTPRS